MNPRSLPLLSWVALTACASPQEKPVPVDPQPTEVFTFHATVASVPTGTSNLLVSVRWPESWPTGVLRPLQAYGLVGNSPFEWPFREWAPGNQAIEYFSTSLKGPAKLSWNSVEEGGMRHREFVVETRGKPLEVALRFAQMPGAPVEASALEQELARGTTATADGQPVQALATRLERVR